MTDYQIKSYIFFYSGRSRKTAQVGGKRNEASTKKKSSKNETIKSKIYVNKYKEAFFLVYSVFSRWFLILL